MSYNKSFKIYIEYGAGTESAHFPTVCHIFSINDIVHSRFLPNIKCISKIHI